MPITCNAYVSKNAECADLLTCKKSILDAAKRAAKKEERTPFTVTLPAGRHLLTEPFRLSAVENPELTWLELTLRAETAGETEISSLTPCDAPFTDVGGGVFTCDCKTGDGVPLFRDLFLSGKHLPRSHSRRFANLDPITPEERSGERPREGLWIPMDIVEEMMRLPFGSPEILLFLEWYYAIFHVTALDLSRTRTEGGVTYALARIREGELATLKRLNPCINAKGREMFVLNSPGLVTDGSYAYDYNEGRIYLSPSPALDPSGATLEYPTLETLFEFEGMKGLTVEGLSFTGTTSRYALEKVYFCNQANTIYSPDLGRRQLHHAAILAKDMRGFTVAECSFRDLGGNGVQVIDFSAATTVKDSRFEGLAMSGVLIGNPSDAWSNPKNRTFNARVENNLFHHIGYEFPSSVCIYFGQVDGVKILCNTVEDCAYSAVSVGWSWSPADFLRGERVNIRDAEIAYNYFHNYMQLLKDGGAVYVLGGNADKAVCADLFNRMHDNFALVDERVNIYGKYGYYCDGASSNWEISHSVVLNTEQMPIFSQNHPQALSYHNHFTEIWTNTLPHSSTHCPSRDVRADNCIHDDLTPEEFLEKYPEARAIRDAAGCDLPL